MNFKSLLALASVLAVISFSTNAFALDQLPLPEAGVSPVQADIMEFASAGDRPVVIDPCGKFLNKPLTQNDEKIRAIKSYRQCRADHALQQLAVWKWQGDLNQSR